ncbi:MAG: tRNA lysidine(34) synthetase TilS, partial [Tabrizicola sp.]|uniref:tRNA lysidine(34) synthetase TilS n=1 Tax=Tabrizicola sp. TaxID=2005166 RepID=UPI003BB18B18
MPVGEGRLVGLIRDGLPADKMIGVALSGGGDSTALLHLCLAAGFRVEAVTVDHRLRADSAAEAAAVGEWCRVLGVRHEIRVWEHGAVEGNLMDQARRARMALIAGWAEARGIGVVALGHTRDDVAETVLMGLSRAAGIAGLSGMRREFDAGRVRVHRPLLDAGREELRAWLRGQGIRWVDDPTNENDRFTRVKARKALAALAPLGITAERLAEVAGHLAQAQAALEVQMAAAGRWIEERAGALRIGP